LRRLDRLAGHGSERIKPGDGLRREKSTWTVDGVTMITAGILTGRVILIQVRTEGSSMEALAKSESHEHRLGRQHAASDM
jgi:hypothetical protein